jgi:hypothetical protein
VGGARELALPTAINFQAYGLTITSPTRPIVFAAEDLPRCCGHIRTDYHAMRLWVLRTTFSREDIGDLV